MGKLTTHVLDTALGRPAAGLEITLSTPSGRRVAAATNSDGRCDAPLLEGADMERGVHELVFMAGDYLKNAGTAATDVLFLDEIPIRFGIDDPDAHYHVPLLLSPFGYSTYRGS
ncbi:MAG: hydroxyisourate hydrolase [Pseudomonadota bacterium]